MELIGTHDLANASPSFGARLRMLREAAGLTRPALAQRSRVSEATIIRAEFDRGRPRASTVLLLAVALGVPVELLEGTPEAVDEKGPARG